MTFKDYIGKEVLIRSNEDYDDGLIQGRLDRIIPAAKTETYFDTLVIISDKGEKLLPVNEIIQFFEKESFNDPDTLYYYVIFRCGKTERSKEHRYMSYDYSIKPGDKVVIWEGFLYVGNVIRTGFFKKNDAPYPVEKTWLIEKKVYDRIDFMRYDDAEKYIKSDNLYKDNYLNPQNGHRQFIARAEYCYNDIADHNDEFIEKSLKSSLGNNLDESAEKEYYMNMLVTQLEYNLDWEWCESNQTDVFYRTLWVCSRLAVNGCFDKFWFDKYTCVSLIYNHGDFDQYLVCPEVEVPSIEKDMEKINRFLLSRVLE